MSAQFLSHSCLNPDQVDSFRKEVRGTPLEHGGIPLKIYQIYGLISAEDDTKFHKYVTFNTFTKETFEIPSTKDGWKNWLETIECDYQEDKENDGLSDSTRTWEQYLEKASKRHKIWIRNHVCDPDAVIFKMPSKGETLQEKFPEKENYKFYRTRDNGGTGFIVIMGNYTNTAPIVYVYSRTKSVVMDDDVEDNSVFFDNEVCVHVPFEIFIGKSPKNKMTDFSGGYGDRFDGNSILLRLSCDRKKNIYRYLCIETTVFEFDTDEPIIKYVSSVGNSCVPYPYAESENWCYSMSDGVKTPVSDHPNREYEGYIDYFDHATYERYDMNIIHGRDSDMLKYAATNREEEEPIGIPGVCGVMIFPAGTTVSIPKNTSS